MDDRTKLRGWPFTWEDLASWRWGPAVGNPTPGVIVDELDLDVAARAVGALAVSDDPEIVAEREAIMGRSRARKGDNRGR